jgi:hypothetical protein
MRRARSIPDRLAADAAGADQSIPDAEKVLEGQVLIRQALELRVTSR